MRIGLDFDNTLTADATLWAAFVSLAKKLGHTVVIVTARRDTHENRADLQDFLESREFPDIPIVFTNLRSKVAHMKNAGMPVDIWVEDDPLTCALGH